MGVQGTSSRALRLALITVVLLLLGGGAQAAQADITVSINDVTTAEGALGATHAATFTVTLSQPAPPGGVSVDYATSDGPGAHPASHNSGDYTFTTGNLTIP